MTHSLITRINSYYDNLSKSDQAISNYLIKNMDSAAHLSIQDFAKNVQVSTATISRFAKKIGFDSFQDLKLAIHSTEKFKSDNFFSELSPRDSYKDILTKNFTSNTLSLNATLQLIDSNTLDEIMNVLLSAKTCGFFGVGGSNAVALIAYHKFLRMPLQTVYHQDFHYQQMLASKLTKNDCAFVISHTGKNKDTLKIVDILKNNQVPVIAITSFAHSALVKKSDLSLISIAEEISFRPEAVASTVSQISLLDAIFLMYGMRSQDTIEHSLENIREVISQTRLN
ncbi:MAG TPA: MurR/RpiR family transcriptional regulator [Lactococcus sp.]|uniref:MurR/RpiR family transcriptional regulator n=1 Tax=Lactococcus muris TaxID=2941330 RepID=A0ABV4DAH3_9LACT|nr:MULTISPECIES: MurR/RpiR family transcriptional regulator [Lactococcus]MBL3716700.1 SIS domain-containing protein [Lactococcus garvieae]HAP14768.1 MurR/RpiR family transcriptional regulator [Lactococcus sp.]HBC91213.1 MurR/RpiR family transcriptional regulator [Lactococcus sp.]